MSSNEKIPPGIQYPTYQAPDLALNQILRNIYDNLFWVRGQLGVSRPLTSDQLRRIQQQIDQTVNSVTNNFNIISTGLFLTGTHNLRLTVYGSATQDVGTAFFETDRNVIYIITSGPKKWEFAAGLMLGLFASRPADLGLFDASFMFFATDTEVLYIWDGTQWLEISGGDVPIETVGYWSPVTNGDGANPELVFDSDGDIVVAWTFTP